MSEFCKACILASVFVCNLYVTTQGQQVAVATHSTVIEFDSTQLRSYREKPDYQYQRKAPKSSWLQRIWNNIIEYFRSIFSSGKSLSEKIVTVVLIAGAIVALVWFFLRTQFFSLFTKRNRRSGPIMRILDEDIPVDTLTERISSAIIEGDFRMAYRWTYLDLLRHLDAMKAIRIVGFKTNTDYLREVDAYPWRERFAELADAFDFIWYGEYPIDEKVFDRYRVQARQLIHQTTAT